MMLRDATSQTNVGMPDRCVILIRAHMQADVESLIFLSSIDVYLTNDYDSRCPFSFRLRQQWKYALNIHNRKYHLHNLICSVSL